MSGGGGKDDPKNWDLFRSTEIEASSASEKNTDLYQKAYKLLKLITIIVCFGAVLGAGVVTKGTTFLMVSQVGVYPPLLPYCTQDYSGPVDTASDSLVCEIDNLGKVAWLWTIFFAFSAPELASFLQAMRTILMKTSSAPAPLEFLICLLFEMVHVIGVAILFFLALPGMDVVRGMMATSAICLMPGVWKLFQQSELKISKFKIPRVVCLVVTAVSILLQMSALFFWPAIPGSIEFPWALPVGLLLTSFGWWESFVEEKSWIVPSKLWLVKTKMCDGGARAITYAVISVVKILTFLVSMIVIVYLSNTLGNAENDFNRLFTGFVDSFSSQHYIISHTNNTYIIDPTNEFATRRDYNSYQPAWLLLVHVVVGHTGYIVANFACRYGIQRESFALPLLLVNPVGIVVMAGLCYSRADNPCVFRQQLPANLFFDCPSSQPNFDWIVEDYAWAWLLWFLSSVWVTLHIWLPQSSRLATTPQMFSTPLYNSLLLDLSMMLNRRSDSGRNTRRFDFKSKHFEELRNKPAEDESVVRRKAKPKPKRKISAFSEANTYAEDEDLDTTTRIYGCATMWHENSEEIAEMLKSIFRIDEDYCARKSTKKFLDIEDPDFYEWETHIFFDDCMERSSEVKDEFIVNQFVRLLVSQVEAYSRKWYGSRKFRVEPPVKIPTPYGGRLVWTLPGGTQIICHLKDKNKIRHKKRWSQCMYMYYFLGYQLMDNPNLTDNQKEVRAENTYLLALDGDVDFQPEAIIKLVDLMKRNSDVGAACGRIHPIGSGYMQWYQMFEYAIGHWLQKATEHMMGCVLCSPGCFSLFRAKAVMDDNVMQKYTTIATQPRHYVQYDQGEDRWLCTLLLQKGWRVEYSAASDSFTACPEGFKEFYNQRRRWMPSTIANIADLLGDYRNVIKNNDDISFPYIIYQIMMMVGTILGPGSIFLMLVGAFNIAFGIANVESLLYNTIIVVVFVLVCFFGKSDHQVMVAMVLSLVYAIIMMAVLVGLFLQLDEDGPLAPTSLSLMFVAGSFILAGVLHPQEIKCLPMGVIYYITIPSMYLLLMIYSIFNLNNVSWGTREVPKSAADLAAEAEKEVKEEEKVATKKSAGAGGVSGLLSYFQSKYDAKKKGTLDFSFGNICSCLMFTNDDDKDTKRELMLIADKLDKIERTLNIKPTTVAAGERPPAAGGDDDLKAEKKVAEKTERRRVAVTIVEPEKLLETRDEMVNPYWMERNDENLDKAPLLANAPVRSLKPLEIQYWYEFIDKYLKPLNENKEEQKRISEGLKELRNQMVMSFLILNCIWVVTIFLLQQNKDTLFILWPIGPHGPNITWDRNTEYDRLGRIELEYEYLELEPLGFVFMLFFAVVMLVQMIGMILHRIMTLGHIISSTNFRNSQSGDADDYLDGHAMSLVLDLQKGYDGEATTSMESAIEKTLQDINEGNQDAIRRLSRAKTIKNKQNPEMMTALKRRNTQYAKRKATMKKRPDPFTNNQTSIQEEDEPEGNSKDFIPVNRTLSKMDPFGHPDRDV